MTGADLIIHAGDIGKPESSRHWSRWRQWWRYVAIMIQAPGPLPYPSPRSFPLLSIISMSCMISMTLTLILLRPGLLQSFVGTPIAPGWSVAAECCFSILGALVPGVLSCLWP